MTNPADKIKGNELELIREKVKSVSDFLDPAKIDLDNTSLSEIITLGDNWDDPMSLMKALDEHPTHFARWSYLYRMTQRKLAYHVDVYKTWEAGKKERIMKKIFEHNLSTGMTATTARPTEFAVTNRFMTLYNPSCESNSQTPPASAKKYISLRKRVDLYETRVEKIKIVIEAFKQRSSLLVSMASLLKSMVDNNLLVLKKKKRH